MKYADPIYNQFLTALMYEVKKKWHRQQNALALEAQISSSALTDILKQKVKAKFSTRNALAEGCGYPYEEFLQMGKNLMEGKDPSLKAPDPFQVDEQSGVKSGYMDPAVQLFREAMEETGATLTNKQKEALTKILREELKKAEAEIKEGIKKYLKAFSG